MDLARELKETPVAAQKAVDALLPTVTSGVASYASTPDGADKLYQLLNDTPIDTDPSVERLVETDSHRQKAAESGNDVLKKMYGERIHQVSEVTTQHSGVSLGSAATLTGLITSVLLGASMGAAFLNAEERKEAGMNTSVAGSTDAGDQTIKVIEENLSVGRRNAESGGVRVRSRIVSRPVEESTRLREERVTVQRNSVNRPVTDADLEAFQKGEITMTEHTEVPVVSKTAQVVEEILAGKEVTERTETVRDTVCRTEVDVEQLGTTDKPNPDVIDTGEITYVTK